MSNIISRYTFIIYKRDGALRKISLFVQHWSIITVHSCPKLRHFVCNYERLIALLFGFVFRQGNKERKGARGKKMKGAKFTGFITVFVALLCRCYTQDAWTDIRIAYESLYNHYYNGGTSLTDIVPALSQDSPLQVTMAMTLSSLNGFDAVKGQIDISGSMLLEWNDEVAFNRPLNAHTGVSEILIDYDKAWSPSIVLVNAVDTVKNIGDATYKLKYLPSQQKVQWQPRVLLRASCSPDVTYYPFDRQVCNFTYSAWGHTSSEIQLSVGSSEWDTSDAENNGVWEIIR